MTFQILNTLLVGLYIQIKYKAPKEYRDMGLQHSGTGIKPYTETTNNQQKYNNSLGKYQNVLS